MKCASHITCLRDGMMDVVLVFLESKKRKNMHVQLDQDNADKLLKIANATNRSVGELVNTFIRAVDNVKYFEELKIEMKPKSTDPPKKRAAFSHTRNWLNRF